MSATEFTLSDLRTILLEAAGTDETVDLDGDILDLDFQDLGYESLALLETAGRIERTYGISLDEEALADARTPRLLVDLVNAHLPAARAV
ncbi:MULTISPECIES: acyl carrier protein [unclassified Streptomyces]|uniref:acyl carrier protein n=1 Tax=unclassified Streptomyces TaxID=2593676 RepID=UPI001F5B0349|nr:phosphopantetheine-binding protein [Streptomyces sp. DSM 110735]